MVAGLKRADAVVTTSRWMDEMLRLAYRDDFAGHVIPAGRNPIYFNPFVAKEESVLAIGRLWDTGKQVALLTQHRTACRYALWERTTRFPRRRCRSAPTCAFPPMNTRFR